MFWGLQLEYYFSMLPAEKVPNDLLPSVIDSRMDRRRARQTLSPKYVGSFSGKCADCKSRAHFLERFYQCCFAGARVAAERLYAFRERAEHINRCALFSGEYDSFVFNLWHQFFSWWACYLVNS